MASSCFCPLKQNSIVSFLFVIITITNSPVNGYFSSMFSFGDSLTDTGNKLQIAISTSTKLPPSAFPPNGQTFFHHPTGRRCDGRLIIDFLDCKELLRSSLIVMGAIGGNDYGHALKQGKDIEEVRPFVPFVVQSIASAIKELIDLGAATILVPGNLPCGCSPSWLTYFQTSDEDEYDPLTGCLLRANQLAEYHNEMLQKGLEKIRNLHPNVSIIYGDYYNAAMRIYHSTKQFGFRETMKACCGMGGAYNFDPSMSCGNPPVTSCCNDPSSFVSWDGIHYTEGNLRIYFQFYITRIKYGFQRVG